MIWVGGSSGDSGESGVVTDWSRTEEPGYVPTGLPRPTRNPITRLLTRRPLRPTDAEVELARSDAKSLGIRRGYRVVVSHNGTSLQLRARLSKDVRPGVARVAEEHAAGLVGRVVVTAETSTP